MALFDFFVTIALSASIFALFALGLNLKWGFAGLLDFGHVAFLALGAYTTVLLSLNGVPLILSIIAGMFLAALAGALLGFPALRLREDYLAIVTLSFAQILNLVLKNEEWLTRGTLGIHGFSRPLDNLIPATEYDYFLLGLVITIIIIVFLILKILVESPWGRVLKSIREDELVSSALGKNVFSYKIQALALGSAIAALAGSLWAFRIQYIIPRAFGPMLTFFAWTAIVLGGSSDNRGTLIGAFLLWGFLRNGTRFLTDYIPFESTQMGAMRLMIIGILLIILMRFKPEGLVGKKEELSIG
ncbi:hypothetical protein AKJ52_01240 [candidate division MSBL1 archaeon SCGC-AAA382C18]|uniref:Branched-chain amino acid ABC transporter permease n=1 Tax=candidate division MSBL1 archaeon SCGC-AAA382C18 TaxID=1698281 RepID=A0A133VKI7_9EURY|nr:hypothetical protein AKJ52_01240 [candidate division MSBL1 archaeon SCGC-AAA382C18]